MEIGHVRGNSSLPPASKGPKAASGRDAEKVRPDQAPQDQLDIQGAARDAEAVQKLAEQSLLESEGDRARRLQQVKTKLLSGELDRPDVFLETARIILSVGSEGFLESWLP
jgi:hypothetical protein